MSDNQKSKFSSTGELLKYHTSREERLSIVHDNPNTTKNCFFCRKNAPKLILMADILLVLLVLVMYNYSVGRAQSKTVDGMLYFYSKKMFGNYDMQNFVFQIKNKSKQTKPIQSTEAAFIVLDVYGNPLYNEIIPITKTSLDKGEMFVRTISFAKLPAGRYLTRLTLNNNPGIVFELYYQSKER